MKSLDEIMIGTGADKASQHPHLAHNYAIHYDHFFSPRRFDKLKMLEIGVGSGPSIQGWLEYFDAAKVFGVDTVHDTNEWNAPGTKGRYTFVNGDQSDKTFWACFKADYGSDWGIVIDDGGHYADQIITSFECLFPLVVSGGYYCIEDLAVAYGTLFMKPDFKNHMDFIKDLLDRVNQKDDIRAVHFSKELAIIQKA